MQDLPLAGFDREAREFVLEQYKLRGIKYHGLSSPTGITKGSDGKLTVTVEPYKREGDTFYISDVDQVSTPPSTHLGSSQAASYLLEQGGLWPRCSDCDSSRFPPALSAAVMCVWMHAQVLLATGRKPRTKGIGLEGVGVELDDEGSLKVWSAAALKSPCSASKGIHAQGIGVRR